jgi:hypothetical protein
MARGTTNITGLAVREILLAAKLGEEFSLGSSFHRTRLMTSEGNSTKAGHKDTLSADPSDFSFAATS